MHKVYVVSKHMKDNRCIGYKITDDTFSKTAIIKTSKLKEMIADNNIVVANAYLTDTNRVKYNTYYRVFLINKETKEKKELTQESGLITLIDEEYSIEILNIDSGFKHELSLSKCTFDSYRYEIISRKSHSATYTQMGEFYTNYCDTAWVKIHLYGTVEIIYEKGPLYLTSDEFSIRKIN